MNTAASTSDPSPVRAIDQIAVNRWLTSHCNAVSAPLQAAVFLHGSQGARLIASHPSGRPVSPWLAAIAERAVAQREPVLISRHVDARGSVQALAHPLDQRSSLVGAVVILRENARPASDDELAALRVSAARFSRLFDTPPPPVATPVDTEATVLSMLRKMSDCGCAREGADMLAIALAGRLECDRVSLGLRRGAATWILASSETADGQHRASHTVDTAAAMDEASDQGCTLVYPADAPRRFCMLAAHAQLSDTMRSSTLCTVPLVCRGEIVGALLAERRTNRPFVPTEVAFLEQAAAAAAPWLRLQRQAEAPWRERLKQQWSQASQRMGRGRYRLAGFTGVLALAAFLGWPVDRQITAPVKLEGRIQRLITAPGDSYLEKVHVRPGDLVKAGQVLLEFSAEDLRVERQRLTAELGARDAAAAQAMAHQEFGALAVQSAKVKETQAQLDLLDQRLKRLRVEAPFDAVVIQGDLLNALGAPTRKGDVLMTLAPADSYRAIIEIDDSDVAEVRKGQTGGFVLTALPQTTLPLRVKSIAPLAIVSQGRSYFESEVEIQPANIRLDSLRPGMRGIARLDGGRRPRGAEWLEQSAAWCRLFWWRWVG